MARIVVLRMGHRIPRDWRLTTHVCLTARAMGADGVVIADIADKEVEGKVRDVVQRFGGGFTMGTGKHWKEAIRDWKDAGGTVVHLTAYGLQLPAVVDEIRDSGTNALVGIGAETEPGGWLGLAVGSLAVT